MKVMVNSQYTKKEINEYIQYVFKNGGFGTEIKSVELESCGIIDDVISVNLMCYKLNGKYEGVSAYPKLEDFEKFHKKALRDKNIEDLLDGQA